MKRVRDAAPERRQTPRNEVTRRIVGALADALPDVLDRDELRDSAELARRFKKTRDKFLPKEKRDAMRTLGRLVGNGLVGEALFLRGEKVGARNIGLVAVSIDLVRLTYEWSRWDRRTKKYEAWVIQGKKANEPTKPETEPNQESIVEEIIQRTKAWLIENDELDENSDRLRLPLLLQDVSIVHGSSTFDILMTVRYRSSDKFMKYIREVVQRVGCVRSTHTMQVGLRRGFHLRVPE
jgi:DNA-binding Lrp family transcriptional regulator